MENGKNDNLDRRIDHINDAAQHVAEGAGRLLHADRKDEIEQREGLAEMLGGLLTIVSTITVSLSELSYHTGRIADNAKRDFEAQVKAEAENLATVKAEEKTKRSFIGNP